MQFNTAQVQELAGIRREQLRHWRKVLPPLMGRDGRGDLYSFADVMALAVIALLVDCMGLPVSRLSACAADIFEFFRANSDLAAWPKFLRIAANGYMIIGIEPEDEIFVSVRVMAVVARVRRRLAPEQRLQLSLPLHT